MNNIQSWDIGSLPVRVEEETLYEGARSSNSILEKLGFPHPASRIFEGEVTAAFIDKINSGLDYPNYPQFRDMNHMFLNMISGIERIEGKYHVHDVLGIDRKRVIPEMLVLKQNISHIREKTGKNKINVKMCITGPYTLSSFFINRGPKLFNQLGSCLSKIVSNSIFRTRTGEVNLLSVDEPLLGMIDDSLLDHGSTGREVLIDALESIYNSAKSRNLETCIHLHDTGNDLFWDIQNLDIIETHVEDPLYELESTTKLLEEKDKKLRASVAVTLFDKLIENSLKNTNPANIPEIVGKTWEKIYEGTLDPSIFLEDEKVIKKRLKRLVNRFGVDRVPYSGPECGLGGFPEYNLAINYLKRISKAIKNFKPNSY